ncbi:MAG TPA: polysaccharide biosynthesis C-terminal domain-containing protein [Ferruginibacter sp.]|nr:polysaccharide biosynthesis C-terminal domain-containing protein [Ferruginibacter sp.]
MITKNIVIRILQQLLLFLITLIIARFTQPQGNGIFSLFITDVSFFVLLLGFCLESGITYFSAKNKITLSQVAALMIPLLFVQVILFFITYYFVAIVFHHTLYKIGLTDKGFLWGLLFIISLIVFNYCNALLSAKKIFFRIVVLNVLTQLIFLTVLFLIYLGVIGNAIVVFKPEVLIPAYTILYAIQAVIAALLVFKNNEEKITWRFDKTIINKDFLHYTAMVYAANLLQFLAYRMDVWLIDYFKTKADVGTYSLAVKIAQLWWLLPQLLSLLLFPLIALEHESVTEDKFKKILKRTVIASVVGAIAAVGAFPVFIHYVMGDIYMPSYIPFIYLLPGVLFFTINILLATRMAGRGNIKINMQASAICFIFILLLDIWLIPMLDIKGAAIASSIGYTISTLYTIIKYQQWIKN